MGGLSARASVGCATDATPRVGCDASEAPAVDPGRPGRGVYPGGCAARGPVRAGERGSGRACERGVGHAGKRASGRPGKRGRGDRATGAGDGASGEHGAGVERGAGGHGAGGHGAGGHDTGGERGSAGERGVVAVRGERGVPARGQVPRLGRLGLRADERRRLPAEPGVRARAAVRVQGRLSDRRPVRVDGRAAVRGERAPGVTRGAARGRRRW
jgi:hypothetical protein